MNFKEWIKLKETGTSTSSIAVFARPLFSSPIKRIPTQKFKVSDKKSVAAINSELPIL